MFPIYPVVFFSFALLVVMAAVMVVFSRNPVRAVLFLVLCFFGSAVLWMLLQAEFLALVLIFVYVGAVMTLFLFVVMMLNIDLSRLKEGFVRYLPLGLLALILLVGLMAYVADPAHVGSLKNAHLMRVGPHHSNTTVMGMVLYTDLIYPFEIAAVILLVAIVASITLVFRGRRHDTKGQDVSQQQQASKADRLRIIKMKAEKR
jgi:NADH-quinone oxidoreductase subunit J